MHSETFYQVYHRVLGPTLFNIFRNYLFLCIKKSDLHNFADDNTITATRNTLTGLLETLEQESESAVSWFRQNEMIVNAVKFQATILNKKENKVKYKLTVDNNDIESAKSVKLLGITIDDRLRFDQHIKFVFQSCNAIKYFRSTPEIYGKT